MRPTMSGPTNELDCRVGVRMLSSTMQTQTHLVCDGEQCVPTVLSAGHKIERVERDAPPCFFTRRNQLCVSSPRIALKSPIRESYLRHQRSPPRINAHDAPKYTASPNISPGVVNPPTCNRLTNGTNPKHPYAGMHDTSNTRSTRTRRFDHAKRRWSAGNTSEPRIPEAGVIAPISTSDEASMCSVVLPKSIAVEVMVVKPATGRGAVSGEL